MEFSNPSNKKRTIGLLTLVMINIIAVDSLRTLPIGAQYGFSLIFYYGVAALFFFIPSALITAELATGWPNTGGVYVWVREAFGQRLGFFTIWLQWIYNVVWYPTILAFIADNLAYLIDPALANNKLYNLVLVLGLFWSVTGLNCLGIKISSWLSIIGACVGTLLPMLLIIGLGMYWLFLDKPNQLIFSTATFVPHLHNLNNIGFLIGLLFGLMGLEMSAVHAGDVKDPERNYPKALIISALLILITLICGSLAIALVVPEKQIGLISGLIDAYAVFFNAYHLQWMVPVLAALIVLSSLTGVSAWLIGPTRGLWVAARSGSLPSLFAKANRYGAPVAILLLQGVIFTIICSVFLLMPSVNSSYWILSVLTGQLALLFYILLFVAAIRLRYKAPHIKRAYHVPGGKYGIWCIAGIAILTCIAIIIVGFLPPDNLHITNVFMYETILIGGMVLFSLPPLILKMPKASNV